MLGVGSNGPTHLPAYFCRYLLIPNFLLLNMLAPPASQTHYSIVPSIPFNLCQLQIAMEYLACARWWLLTIGSPTCPFEQWFNLGIV